MGRVEFLYVVCLTLLICWDPIKLIIACGDSGQSSILAERDRAEEPVSNKPNVRLLKRRSTGHQGQRKACGDGNTQTIPLIRYGITLIRSINKFQEKSFVYCTLTNIVPSIKRYMSKNPMKDEKGIQNRYAIALFKTLPVVI